jgi:hypothetical protein
VGPGGGSSRAFGAGSVPAPGGSGGVLEWVREAPEAEHVRPFARAGGGAKSARGRLGRGCGGGDAGRPGSVRGGIGMAISGIPGPSGATPEKPVGLVYLALADGATGRVVRVEFGSEPGREGIKYLASQTALVLLRRHL